MDEVYFFFQGKSYTLSTTNLLAPILLWQPPPRPAAAVSPRGCGSYHPRGRVWEAELVARLTAGRAAARAWRQGPSAVRVPLHTDGASVVAARRCLGPCLCKDLLKSHLVHSTASWNSVGYADSFKCGLIKMTWSLYCLCLEEIQTILGRWKGGRTCMALMPSISKNKEMYWTLGRKWKDY